MSDLNAGAVEASVGRGAATWPGRCTVCAALLAAACAAAAGDSKSARVACSLDGDIMARAAWPWRGTPGADGTGACRPASADGRLDAADEATGAVVPGTLPAPAASPRRPFAPACPAARAGTRNLVLAPVKLLLFAAAERCSIALFTASADRIRAPVNPLSTRGLWVASVALDLGDVRRSACGTCAVAPCVRSTCLAARPGAVAPCVRSNCLAARPGAGEAAAVPPEPVESCSCTRSGVCTCRVSSDCLRDSDEGAASIPGSRAAGTTSVAARSVSDEPCRTSSARRGEITSRSISVAPTATGACKRCST